MDARKRGTMQTLLQVLIHKRDLATYVAFRAAFERAARELAAAGVDRVAGLTISRSTFERWRDGKVSNPNLDSQRVLVALFEQPFEALISTVSDGDSPDARLVPPAHQFTEHHIGGADVAMGRRAAMAAERALRFAVVADNATLGAETIDHLRTEISRLAAEYTHVPLNAVLSDIIEAQELTFQLIESGRGRPTQVRDLYFMASLASSMMSKASHDLGDPRNALAQARTAYICAQQAEHQSMQRWVRGLQSLISYWAGQPDQAARFAALGLQEHESPGAGSSMAWLACLDARAQALIGDEERVQSALRRAADARESIVPDDLDEIGGLMTFGLPRQLYYEAEATVLVGTLEDAAQRAETAVSTYSSSDPRDRAIGDEAGAHAHLALARVAKGDVDGAVPELRAVLDLPASHRIHGVVVSVNRVGVALGQSPVRSSAVARNLRAEIELYTRAAVTALPR